MTTFLSSCSNNEEYSESDTYKDNEGLSRQSKQYQNYHQEQRNRRISQQFNQDNYSPLRIINIDRVGRSNSTSTLPKGNIYSPYNLHEYNPIGSAHHRKSSLIDIPVHHRESFNRNLSTNQMNYKREIHHSLPSLINSRGARGQWPSNVTSITTRSVVRQDPMLSSISESEVFHEKSKQEHTTHRQYSSHHYHKKQHNDYRHSEDRNESKRHSPLRISEIKNIQMKNKSRRYSENNYVHEEDEFRHHNNTVMHEINTLVKSVENIEDQLLNWSNISFCCEQLCERVDELTSLQSKIRFDGLLVDKLLYNVDKMQYKTKRPLSSVDTLLNDTLQKISNAIRRWETVVAEVNVRQRITDTALRTSRKCELLLTIEEAWLKGVQSEEQRIRNSLSDHYQEGVILKSLKDLQDELTSHSLRISRINELSSKFGESVNAYGAKVEKYRENLLLQSTNSNQNLHFLHSGAINRSNACLLSGRVEKLNRNYNDLLDSCNCLIQELTNLVNYTENSSYLMLHQNATSAVRNQTSHVKSNESPIPLLTSWDFCEHNKSDSSFTNSVEQLPKHVIINAQNNRTASSLTENLIQWMGSQKVIYDCSTLNLTTFSDLVSSNRLIYSKHPQDKLLKSLNNCYILSTTGNNAISRLSSCLYKPLKSLLSKSGGFFCDDKSKEISLLQAITSNMINLQNGGIRVGPSQQLISIENAYKCNYINEKGIKLLLEFAETLQNLQDGDSSIFDTWINSISHIHEKYRNIYNICDEPLSLQDYFNLNLISIDGGLLDPTSGKNISLASAIQRGIISSDVHEIVYSGSVSKLTLNEAIARKVIDTGTNPLLQDLGKAMNLHNAILNDLIEKPITLADAFVQNLVDEAGCILHKRTSQRLSFNDAIEARLLDNNCPHIVHPVSKTLLSIKDALQIKLIDNIGNFYDPTDDSKCSLYESVKSNRLQLISLKPTINGAIIRENVTNRMITIAEAFNTLNIIDLSSNTYTDSKTKKTITIDNAISAGYILPVFHSYMNKILNSKEAQINGDTIQKCLQNEKIKLIENVFCFDSIGNEFINYFIMSIPDAVKCEIISMADGAILREIRGAITREAYITAYVASENIKGVVNYSLDDSSNVDHRKHFVLRPPIACIDGFDAADIISLRHQHDAEPRNALIAETAALQTNSIDYIMTSNSTAYSHLHMNFIDAVNSQFLNIDTGRFIHPLTQKSISIKEALRQKLINPCTVYIIDHLSDKSYNLQEAVNEGLISEENQVYDKKLNQYISIAEAIKTGLMRLGDSSLSYYSIISKTESLSIKSVKDTKTGLYIDPNKAIKLDILDLHQGAYFDRLNDMKKYTIDQAIALGFIIVEGLNTKNDKASMSPFRGSDKVVSTSLIRETRSYNLVGVVDALSREEMSVQEALDIGILNRSKGQYFDRRKKQWTSISEAINDNLIKVTLVPVSANKDEYTNKRAVSETKTYALKGVKNTKSGEIIGLRKAIEEGIIDQRTGLFFDTISNETMPISLAVERNFIITEEDDFTSRKHMCYGPTYVTKDTRYLSVDNVVDPCSRHVLSLDEAINKGILNTLTCTFYNLQNKKNLSLPEAYSSGYLIGKYVSEDEIVNTKKSLIVKVCREERSYIVISVLDTRSKLKLNLHDAIDKGLFNMDRAVYINPLTSEESSLSEAITNGYVDAKMLDGSIPDHPPPSSTKVIRVQKRPSNIKYLDNKADVYKLDTLEEYVETMREYQTNKSHHTCDNVFNVPNSTVNHSTYHTVHHKERNVKERDIVLKSGNDVIEPIHTRLSQIEEIVIDGNRNGERVIDVTSTPCSTVLPIVIEENRPKPLSRVIVVDDDNVPVMPPNAEIRRDIQISTVEHKKINQHDLQQEVNQSRTFTDLPETRTLIVNKSPEQEYQHSVHIEQVEKQYKETIVKPQITTHSYVDDIKISDDQQNQQMFIDEVLNKAKTYRSSIQDDQSTTFIKKECTYVMRGLVHTLSWVLDPKTRQKISLDEGIERGIFITKNMTYHDTIEKIYYDTEQAVKKGLIGTDEDCSSVEINADGITYTIHWVLDPSVKHRILPRKAIDKGVLDINKLRYFNPQNNVSISIHEAVKMKFIGADEQRPDSNEIKVRVSGHTVTFSWVMDTVAQKRVSAYDALKRGLIDINAGVYLKQNTGDVMTLWDALQTGFIGIEDDQCDRSSYIHKSSSIASLDDDELTISTKTATYVITGVIHPVSQQELKVSDAIELGILDKNTGSYKDLNTGITYELSEAINDGLMYATIIESKETTEMETSSTKHVFQRYIINKVIDPRNGKVIGGLQAQAAGILNYSQGLYSDPDTTRGIPIREAIEKTLIEVELINQTSDEQFELDLIRDSLLERRITIFSIFNVIDPVIEENISAQEAVNRGILDSDTKTYFNAGNGEYYELNDALARGLIQADVKEQVVRKPLCLSLQNAVRLGFYNYDTGKFKDPCSELLSSLNEAVDNGHIHINGPAIACVNNDPVSLRDAINSRLISRTTGILDRQRLANLNGKVSESRIYRMNVEDAVRCGLLDLHTGLYKHIHSGERLELKEAISRGLLDGDSIIMEHPITGSYMSLREALSTILIDRHGAISDIYGHNKSSTLDKEFNHRRLFSAFNVNTGELFIPKLSEMISFEKYVQRAMLETKLHLYNFKTDREYNINEAIEHGLMDIDTGKIFDHAHHETMSVREAIRRGIISIIGAPVVPFKADHDALAVRVTSRKRRLSSRTRSGGVQSVASGDIIHYSDQTLQPTRLFQDTAMDNLTQNMNNIEINSLLDSTDKSSRTSDTKQVPVVSRTEHMKYTTDQQNYNKLPARGNLS